MYNAFSWVLALLATFQLLDVAIAADDTTRLCKAFDVWNSTNRAQPYLFIPNAWGDDGSGGSCLNITNNGAAWTLTHKWTGVPTLVKQYAHMKAWPSNLPVRMRDISHLELKGDWSTVVDGTQSANASEQARALHLNSVRSNVAVDMFLSANATNSTGSNPPIEIMIWPWYSSYVKPLGWAEVDPKLHVVMVDNMNFSLYHGWNDGGQHVFSWLAHRNMTSTDADYEPLIRYIWQKGLLSPDLFVGQVEFGTEVLHSGARTIFSASNYNMNLVRKGDPDDYIITTSTIYPTATGTATATGAPVTTTATIRNSSSAGTKTRVGLIETTFGLMTIMMFMCLY